jgi:hypothetical protein
MRPPLCRNNYDSENNQQSDDTEAAAILLRMTMALVIAIQHELQHVASIPEYSTGHRRHDPYHTILGVALSLVTAAAPAGPWQFLSMSGAQHRLAGCETTRERVLILAIVAVVDSIRSVIPLQQAVDVVGAVAADEINLDTRAWPHSACAVVSSSWWFVARFIRDIAIPAKTQGGSIPDAGSSDLWLFWAYIAAFCVFVNVK